jgi:hypothetical protein
MEYWSIGVLRDMSNGELCANGRIEIADLAVAGVAGMPSSYVGSSAHFPTSSNAWHGSFGGECLRLPCLPRGKSNRGQRL